MLSHYFSLFFSLFLLFAPISEVICQPKDFIPFLEKKKWGLLNQAEDVVVEPLYDEIKRLRGSFYKVRKKTRWGIVSAEGEKIIPLKYSQSLFFLDDSLIRVEKDGRQGFYHINGERKAKCRYEEIGTFWLNRARVKRNGKTGFIDQNGLEFIKPEFDTAVANFIQGQAFIQQNGLWGLIDTMGNWVFDPQFEKVGFEFRYGFCKVNKGYKEGYIDRLGNKILVNKEEFLPPLGPSKTIENIRQEATFLENCLKNAKVTKDDAEELAESSSFLNFSESNFPLKIEIVDFESRCAWKISSRFTSHTREGDCRYTNGCTVVLTKTIYLEMEEGKQIHYDSKRKLYPNYE